jgi:hypothetical protein
MIRNGDWKSYDRLVLGFQSFLLLVVDIIAIEDASVHTDLKQAFKKDCFSCIVCRPVTVAMLGHPV